jgi:hypothetical protein
MLMEPISIILSEKDQEYGGMLSYVDGMYRVEQVKQVQEMLY